MTQEECETLAAEAQKLGWKAARHHRETNYKQAREKLAQTKSNRGWRATYSERGSIKMGSKEAEERLKKIKAKTTRRACHKKGHWRGDPERDKTRKGGGRSSGGGCTQRGGCPDGILRRAGFAMATAARLLLADASVDLAAVNAVDDQIAQMNTACDEFYSIAEESKEVIEKKNIMSDAE